LSKTYLLLIMKFAISVVLIVWIILSQLDFSELKKVAHLLNFKLLLVAFLMKFVGLYLSASRWKKLLYLMNVKVGLLSLMSSYLVGLFFNNFLPTRMGGDIMRTSDLRLASKSLSRSAAVVFVERFLGISCLIVFAFVASLLKLSRASDIPAIWIGLVLGFLGILMIVLLLQFGWIGKIIKLFPISEFRDKVGIGWETFQDSALFMISSRRTLIWGFYYSFLLQVNVIIHFFVIGMAFGFEIPFVDYFFLIPIQLFILVLPSINGLGLREVSNIMLLASYGISSTEAISFGFIEYLMLLMISSLGGLRFITRKSVPVHDANKGESDEKMEDENSTGPVTANRI